MSKNKVLFIQPCFVNFGGYFRSFSLARFLAKKGFKVDLLISSKENSILIRKEEKIKNLTVFSLPRLNLHQFINGKILRGFLGCFFIVFGKYDIVHIFESVQFETNIPLLFCKLIGKKVVLDIDEEWLDNPIYYLPIPLMKHYIEFCDLKLAPRFPHMTVTSDYLVKKFKKLGVKNVIKIINGVDFDQFHPMKKSEARKHLKISSQEKILLSFGNTYEGGRAYLLFKTFEEILKKDKSVKLYFNFRPEHFLSNPRVKKEINTEIFKNIVTTGYIKEKMLPYYLGAADLILFLTEKTRLEKACFPIRIGSYLNGERVIAINRTDTEAYNSLTKYNCVVSGDKPAEVAQNVIKFFHDKSLRKKLEQNALKAKNGLSMEAQTNQLINFYQKTLDVF